MQVKLESVHSMTRMKKYEADVAKLEGQLCVSNMTEVEKEALASRLHQSALADAIKSSQ